MSLPVTIPNQFANATAAIPLSQLDANFGTLANVINDINSGAQAIANLKSSNVEITGGIISNVTLDNVSVDVETFSNVTINTGTLNNVTIASGNATVTNLTATQANVTTANVATLQTANLQATGGIINGVVIGGITPAAGSFTTLSATSLVVAQSVSWAQSTDTYSGGGVTDVHRNMRRCVVRDNGQVNYYLSATDSTQKTDGSASNLTGADGQVMVEIPAFYVKFTPGSTRTWSISLLPADGYSLHPAFIKNGEFVPYRYYGAYDACVFNGSVYESGLNYDNNWTAGQNWSADGSAAKLASVSGVYPAVGITRANARTLASNRGAGWRQVDVYLEWAVELLFLVEFGTFRTQQTIGNGNTNVTNAYNAPSSGNQTDSPHSVAGKSNALGNASTNTTSGASSGTRDTAYMSYRGIENWYGNCWNWVDGYNINSNQAYVSNNNTQFADDTATNYNLLGAPMIASDGYVTNCQNDPFAFLPSAVGGSTNTYWADYYYQSSGWRVPFFGGGATDGASAGGFFWHLSGDSSTLLRVISARLAF